MTDERLTWAIAGFGILTSLVLAVGADTAGGLMALPQLCLLVGGPIALVLADDLRSRAAVVVLAAALSVAITAIAVQSLVWFGLATSELIVLLATAYGFLLARLLSSTSSRRRNADRSATEVARW